MMMFISSNSHDFFHISEYCTSPRSVFSFMLCRLSLLDLAPSRIHVHVVAQCSGISSRTHSHTLGPHLVAVDPCSCPSVLGPRFPVVSSCARNVTLVQPLDLSAFLLYPLSGALIIVATGGATPRRRQSDRSRDSVPW